MVCLFSQVLLDSDKRLRVHAFELNFGLILNFSVKQRQVVLTNAFDRMGQQHLRCRQRMMSTRTDFCENRVLVLEENPMTVRCDVDAQ